MPVKAIGSKAEFDQIINSGKVVAIDFWAEWCGPCRVISPVFEQHSNTNDKIEFYKVDVDAQSEISQEVGVRAMPTFAIFKNGNKVNELVGAHPGRLEELLQASSSLA